jgi:hypothetical protein
MENRNETRGFTKEKILSKISELTSLMVAQKVYLDSPSGKSRILVVSLDSGPRLSPGLREYW